MPIPRRSGLGNRGLAGAIVAFVALPGLFAYALPLIAGLRWGRVGQASWLGAFGIAAGSVLLIACVREFHRTGKGTLAPWAPPVHLVTTGPYHFTRNPMYVAVVTIALGWAVYWHLPGLGLYAVLLACGFHLRVIAAEEPWAERNFKGEWLAYRARTPRWLLRLR